MGVWHLAIISVLNINGLLSSDQIHHAIENDLEILPTITLEISK